MSAGYSLCDSIVLIDCWLSKRRALPMEHLSKGYQALISNSQGPGELETSRIRNEWNLKFSKNAIFS